MITSLRWLKQRRNTADITNKGDAEMNEVEPVLSVTNQLGESPIWVAEEGALYWIDIDERTVLRFHPSTGHHESFDLDARITALAARASGGFVIATANGLAFWDPKIQELNFIGDPEADKPSNRFNDGAVDRQGRFWAGTLNESDFEASDGALYRLDPDRSIHKMETGIAESNGVGWSPDNRTMYFTETMRGIIWAYDYDPGTGAINNRRPFVQLPGENVYPDGLTVDSEGFVWGAQWGGWNVTRYDPTGKIERVVRLPAQQITSCAFGGENLDELYITSAWTGLSEEARKGQPLAGALFRIKGDVKGIVEPKFAG
jgi:sugar lactone lactonase YvrE